MLRGRAYDAAALMDTGRTSASWYRGGFAWQAMTAWGAALPVGLLFTEVDWFGGPPAGSWIGRNGLGRTVTIVVAGVLYAVLPRPAGPVSAGRPDTEEEQARAAVSI